MERHEPEDENQASHEASHEEEFVIMGHERGALPSALYSEETGEPFACCVECGIDLLEGRLPYMLQKCSNGRETVFEFALCMPCAETLQSGYSDASRSAIETFFSQRCDQSARAKQLFAEGAEPSFARWTEYCLTCNRKPGEREAHAIAALCSGSEVIYSHAPLLICSQCEEQLNAQLSPETRGEWDRFIERNFDTPPSGEILPDRPKFVFV